MSQSFRLDASQDRTIRGDVYACEETSNTVIVVSHGYKGFKDWGMFPHVCRELSRHAHVVAFNFSHNGVGDDFETYSELDKFARNTFACELEDLHTVVTKVMEGKLPIKTRPERVFLLGHSRGGGISMLYAIEQPENVSGVISWNGMVDFPSLYSDEQKREMAEKGRSHVWNGRTKQQMPLDKVLLDDIQQNRTRYDLEARISALAVPGLLVQGTEDFERLRRGSERLVQVCPRIEHEKVPGGDHTFGTRHPFTGSTEALEEAIARTAQFVRRYRDLL